MKKIAIATTLITIILIMAIAFALFKTRTFKVAVISDIHLGTTLCNPKQCGSQIEDAFEEVLDKTDNMLLISAGDNVDASEFYADQEKATALRETYKARLLEMAGNRTVLWANGNHDRDNYLSGQEFYSYDKNNWRFIIIHTTDVEGGQYDWLADQLKTDKKVMVIMHHPIFKQGSRKIIDRYINIEKLFSENKVKYVLSGHWHGDDYERNLHGVIYKAIPGLTYYFKTNYKIMNLQYRMIDEWNLPPSIKRFL